MILPLVVLSAISVTTNIGLLLWSNRLERERGHAVTRERDALERLVQARKDGYEVPEQVAPAADPVESTLPLIPELQALVSEWDSDVGQIAQMGVIRRMLSTGKSQMEVYRALVPATVEPEVVA